MDIIIAQVVNFAIVVFILVYYGRKPLADFLATRSDGLAKLITEAEKESKEVFAELNTLQGKIAGKESEAKSILEDAKSSVSRQREQVLKSAKVEAERIVKEGEKLGQGELLKKAEGLQREIAEKALLGARKYLSSQLENKDREGLIGEYIELVNHGTAR